MHTGALTALEFDRVVDAVTSFALTPLGAEKLARLRPLTDPRSIRTALTHTTEGVRFLEANRFPLDAPDDFNSILAALAIEAQILEPAQLLKLTAFLESVEQVCQSITTASGGPFPALSAIVDGCATWGRECGDVRKKVDASGDVADDASSALKTIRGRARKQRNRLRGNLESYLRGRDTARYLQENVVTERSGRFVLIVRSEHRTAIPGIVHGSSASGASLFLEPLSTVDINNEIVALEEQEREEIRRVLLALAMAFRRRAVDLHRTLTVATEIDVLQARAQFADAVGGVEPRVTTDHTIELRDARHPLLMASVRRRLGTPEEGEPVEPVPVDIVMSQPTRALIITGPNTGGKTVALKTAGLLALMAQAGLHIPAAAGCRVPVFRSVFADIGDEQARAIDRQRHGFHQAIVGPKEAGPLGALGGDHEDARLPTVRDKHAVFVHGDGNRSLSRAIKAVIQGDGIPLARERRFAEFVLDGNVHVGDPENDLQRVEIVWTVSTTDRREIGRATQKNLVEAGTFSGAWGEVAAIVAEAALEGIQGVLRAAGASRFRLGPPERVLKTDVPVGSGKLSLPPPRLDLEGLRGRP